MSKLASVKSFLLAACAAGTLASCDKEQKPEPLNEFRKLKLPTEFSVTQQAETQTQASASIKYLTQLSGLGYKFNIEHAVLQSKDVDENKNSVKYYEALDALGLTQYRSPTLEKDLIVKYSNHLITRAENLDVVSRTVNLPRYSVDTTTNKEKLVISDNFSGNILTINVPPTKSDVDNFKEFAKVPTPKVPIMQEYTFTEGITFSDSPESRIWNLPKSVNSFIEISFLDLSFGGGQEASGKTTIKLGEIVPNKAISKINGIVDSITLSFDVEQKPIEIPTRDKFGNIFESEFWEDRSRKDGSGKLMITIHPTSNFDNHPKNATSQTIKIDLKPLKALSRELAESSDEITLSTAVPKQVDFLDVKFISRLSKDSESNLTADTLALIIKAIDETEELMGCDKNLVKSVILSDGGINGSNSFFTTSNPSAITIADTHLLNDRLSSVVRHEVIHLLDNHYKISRDDKFISLFKNAHENSQQLMLKIGLAGDHPMTNPEEMLETLLHVAIEIKEVKNKLSGEEKFNLANYLKQTRQILHTKIPEYAGIFKYLNFAINELNQN